MPIERAADHPTFELAGNTVTSFAAPSRGSDEVALFRTDLPPRGGIPPHHHDHHDVFLVLEGGVTLHHGDEVVELEAGDSAWVPTGVVHFFEAGDAGATVVVTMIGGTRFIREDDGSETVPPWVG